MDATATQVAGTVSDLSLDIAGLPDAARQTVEGALESNQTLESYFAQGCNLPGAVWEWLNREGAFLYPALSRFVAPFPPPDLMENVSGLTAPQAFGSHGADFWQVLSSLAPRALTEFNSILDLGCGCGRLMRMFLGHKGRLSGCDIDPKHVTWVGQNLPYCSAHLCLPDGPLPFPSQTFDFIVSISIFTHLTEASQDILLGELHRVAKPDAVLLLTIHGERALERAIHEPKIWEMIAVERSPFERARADFRKGQYGFILQHGHLTTDSFKYGISFAPQSYIEDHWSEWFDLDNYASGLLHDWQDVLVLRPRAASGADAVGKRD